MNALHVALFVSSLFVSCLFVSSLFLLPPRSLPSTSTLLFFLSQCVQVYLQRVAESAASRKQLTNALVAVWCTVLQCDALCCAVCCTERIVASTLRKEVMKRLLPCLAACCSVV